MTKHHVLFIIGVLIVFMPFIGIPYGFKTFLIFIGGLAVAALAVLLHVEKKTTVRRTTRTRRKVSSVIPLATGASQVSVEETDYQVEADLDATETQ